MPHHEMIALAGVIRNVFAHRFTLEAKGKVHLADLGPKGAEIFLLSEGLEISLKGEQRPSEIKVIEIAAKGKTPVAIHHKKPHHGPGHHPPRYPAPHHHEADPKLALRAAEVAGWSPSGKPQRKPQHFEVLARQGKRPWAELHIDLDGGLYKIKALPPDGGKWAQQIG
jgi:hypothetical protein